MDRNPGTNTILFTTVSSLSARRAWIEILIDDVSTGGKIVALRKESVDRNTRKTFAYVSYNWSLSARRAWIEIPSPKIL